MHLLTKVNSTNNLASRKVNDFAPKKFFVIHLKKENKKKEFIKVYFLNNLLNCFFMRPFMNEKTTSITSL